MWAALALVSAALAFAQSRDDNWTIRKDVSLVVLHATVVDKSGHFVTELEQDRFRVFEDGVEQKLAVFRDEEVPMTVGLVLDNSASMRENRRAMVAGALAFVKNSNPLDEVFIVNFMDDYYLDLEGKDFTSDIDELKAALEKTTTRGNTAYYDALRASLRHLQRGTRQKKALLVISDGADRASVSDFQTLLDDARKSEAAVYIVSPPCQDESRRYRSSISTVLESFPLVRGTGRESAWRCARRFCRSRPTAVPVLWPRRHSSSWQTDISHRTNS